MKFAMVASLNESHSSSQLILKKFTGLCEFLKPLGYQGIELAILEPEKIPVKELKEIADSYQMAIPAIGTGATFLRFRYSLGDLHSQIRQKAIARIREYIEFSTISNSKVIIGLIRGRYTYKNTPLLAKRHIIASLKQCCQYAESSNVNLLIEPINRFEIDSCNTIEETLALIEEIGSPSLKLMVDSFHTHLEEDPKLVWDYLQTIAHKIAHLHLADDTRRAPGSGHFNFQKFLMIFKENNYNGFASIETIMKPSFEAVATQTMTYMQTLGII
ncbi:MAG: sugar phosphate isomerase/epimerase family protein [Candidatus Helarchaeota archaeon]